MEMKWHNGVGVLRCGEEERISYDKKYLDTYLQYENTPIGQSITSYRVNLLLRNLSEIHLPVLDVGIGSGHFIRECLKHKINVDGADVNPVALEWLKKCGMLEKHNVRYDVLTFWDSLEHLDDPKEFIQDHHSPKHIFVSIPIFHNKYTVKDSRHYKPGEHIYYFTQTGLINWFYSLGYEIQMLDDSESRLFGRNDIYTYYFKKV